MRPWEPAGIQACVGFARHLGMGISAPHVNLATLRCRIATVRDGRLRSGESVGPHPSPGRERRASSDAPFFVAGLSTVRWLQDRVVERIVRSRGELGPFASLADFVRRVDPGPRSARILALAGCLDGFPEAGSDGWQGRTRTLLSLRRLARNACGSGSAAPMLEGFEDSGYPEYCPSTPTLVRIAADEARHLGAVYSCVPAGMFAARAASLAGCHGVPSPAGWPGVRGMPGERASVSGIVIARESLSGKTKTVTTPAYAVLEDESGLFVAAAGAGTGSFGVEDILRHHAAVLLSGFVDSPAGSDVFSADFALGLDRRVPRPRRMGAPGALNSLTGRSVHDLLSL